MSSRVAPREERTALGLLAMAGAVVFFTLIDTSAKWLVLAGHAAIQAVFARYAGHLIVSLIVFLPREGFDALRSNAPKRQALRAAFLFSGTTLNFIALKYLPITVTTTIMFAGPIVVTLLAIPVLGERVGIHRIIAVCVGFLGVVVVMQPWGAEFHPAMFLNLAALCLAACYFVMTRMLAGIESNATSQLWVSGLATICLTPFAFANWTWPTGIDWVFFLLIGVFGASGHILVTAAHRVADASILAPVIYIQIFFATIAGIIFFDTWPTVWTLGGGLIIIAAGFYIWHRERGHKTRPATLSKITPK
jgi:drug/metabolite transporter (DMT)-like permease